MAGPVVKAFLPRRQDASLAEDRAGQQTQEQREQQPQKQQPDATDELQLHLAKLALLVEVRQRQILEREEEVEKAKAAIAARASAVEGVLSRASSSSVIHLNVGGTHISTSRRTLTLVQDSLLATMFGGAWDDRLDRDADGRSFLDYDPALFLLLLNWLRTQDMGGPEAPLGELSVAAGQEEALLVLVNFLQLQRHVPLRFHETFSASRSSPHCTVSGSSAWRLATGGKGEYAAAALAHNYYDVHAEVLLEVLSFGAVPRHRSTDAAGPVASGSGALPAGGSGKAPGRDPAAAAAAAADDPLPNHPMFVGIVTRQQLEAVDQSKRPKKGSSMTWQSTCYGWWTSRRHACQVVGGSSKETGGKVLWAEGDTLLLSLDCRKHMPKAAARLSLTNTRTNAVQHLTIEASSLQGFEESWVVFVGLAGRADEVRVHSVKHHGMKPQAGGLVGGGGGGGA